jgi:hypothetical protein
MAPPVSNSRRIPPRPWPHRIPDEVSMFDAVAFLLELIGDVVHALVSAPFAGRREEAAE